MQGTLVSETTDTIIFRDDQGIQFSLKKQSLALDKMDQANLPESKGLILESQKETPSPSDKTTPPTKKGKTYGSEDIERLRQKYGEAGTTDTSEDEQGGESVQLTPTAYYEELQEAADRAAESTDSISRLAHEIETIWTVSKRTGQDPKEWITEFMNRDASQKMTSYISDSLAALKSAKQRLSSPPEEFEGSFGTLEMLMNTVFKYQDAFQNYLVEDVDEETRQEFASLQNQVADLTKKIKSVPPPKEAK